MCSMGVLVSKAETNFVEKLITCETLSAVVEPVESVWEVRVSGNCLKSSPICRKCATLCLNTS